MSAKNTGTSRRSRQHTTRPTGRRSRIRLTARQTSAPLPQASRGAYQTASHSSPCHEARRFEHKHQAVVGRRCNYTRCSVEPFAALIPCCGDGRGRGCRGGGTWHTEEFQCLGESDGARNAIAPRLVRFRHCDLLQAGRTRPSTDRRWTPSGQCGTPGITKLPSEALP